MHVGFFCVCFSNMRDQNATFYLWYTRNTVASPLFFFIE